MNILIKFCALFVLIIQSNIIARINDITTMKGWHDCFTQDKKYLSPFRGFVWWETQFLKKMLLFGNVDRKSKSRGAGGVRIEATGGDATIQLIYELFQIVDGAPFIVNENSHIAYYLNPELIGKILNCLESPARVFEEIEKTFQAKEKDQDKNKIKGIIQRAKGKTIEEKFNSLQQKAADYCSVFQALLNLTIRSSLESPKKEALKNCNKFVDLFVKALQESGHLPGKERLYPSYVPHAILLTFMYEKADDSVDFKAYVRAFSLAVTNENWEQILEKTPEEKKEVDGKAEKRAIDEKVGYRIDTVENIEADFKDAIDQDGFIREKYEDICLSQISRQFYPYSTPDLRDYSPWIKFNRFSFASCSEWAMCCLIRLIMSKIGLFDVANKKFDLENLESKMVDFLRSKSVDFDEGLVKEKLTALKKIFEPFNDPVGMYSDEFAQAWGDFVSNRDGIKYSCLIDMETGRENKDHTINRKQPFIYQKPNQELGPEGYYRVRTRDGRHALCQLAALPSMYFNLASDLLGITFKNIEELCSVFDFKIKNKGEAQNLSDEVIIDRLSTPNPLLKIFLITDIGDKKVSIKMGISAGHGYIELDRESVELPETRGLFLYLQSKYSQFYEKAIEQRDDFIILDLFALFGKYSESDYFKIEGIDIRGVNYLWFILDLDQKQKDDQIKKTFLDIYLDYCCKIYNTPSKEKFLAYIKEAAKRMDIKDQSEISSSLVEKAINYMGGDMGQGEALTMLRELCNNVINEPSQKIKNALLLHGVINFLQSVSFWDPSNFKNRGKNLLVEMLKAEMHSFAWNRDDSDNEEHLLSLGFKFVEKATSLEIESGDDLYTILSQAIEPLFRRVSDVLDQKDESLLLSLKFLKDSAKECSKKKSPLRADILKNKIIPLAKDLLAKRDDIEQGFDGKMKKELSEIFEEFTRLVQ